MPGPVVGTTVGTEEVGTEREGEGTTRSTYQGPYEAIIDPLGPLLAHLGQI